MKEWVRQFKEAIKLQSQIFPEDDVAAEEAWDRTVTVCLEHVDYLLEYLRTDCSASDISWLSEVFDELVQKAEDPALVVELVNTILRFPTENKKYYLMDNLDLAISTYGDYPVRKAYEQAVAGASHAQEQ